MPVMPSKTELLPADWSPATISWGRLTLSLIPPARREDICRNRLIDWADCSADRAALSSSSDIVQGAEDNVTEHSCGGKALKYSETSEKQWIKRWRNKHMC